MYQVIARKYRPQSFAELLGQEHVRTTLENAIAQNRIAHGYIFAGQRGTGKTTVARILARCLNCVQGPTTNPCGVCPSCIEAAAGGAVDVIEIDAASNRGINEMRELRENIRYRPARDRYKVFIIDEAHQITSEAFNALLKTLEEPPEWVVFILCTTEAHKIPTTIASRCQQFSFRSVDFNRLIERMGWICRQENITADADVLAVLAQAGEGSVRDSLSALDQAIACCGSTLTLDEVRSLLGVFSLEALGQVTDALAASSPQRMLEIVDDLERNGRNLQHFCRELSRYFRNLTVAKVAGGGERLIAASPNELRRLAEIAGGFSEEDLMRYWQITLDVFRDLQASLQPRLHVEIGLLRLVHAGRLLSIEEALANQGGGGPPAPSGKKTEPPSTNSPGTRMNAAPAALGTPAVSARAVQTPPAAPAAPNAADSGDWRQRLHAAMMELGMAFTADAVEHSQITESGSELQFVTPKTFALAMKAPDIQKALQHLGQPMRVKITIGEPAQAVAPVAKTVASEEDELARRALENPEVRHFQDLFPQSHVRAVRNLKE